MNCPSCRYAETKVIDSRLNTEGTSVRRRRECLACHKRFTTYEYVEHVPLMVVKKDSRRQPFDRNRLMSGIVKACEKRPVSVDQIEQIVEEIERTVQLKYDREVESKEIGEMIMKKLSGLDEVAYVRFASVYRQFRDVNQFMSELQNILGKTKKGKL
jgi:transcriptional repressor NrdR